MIGLLESMSSTGAARDLKGSRIRIIADARTNRIVLKGDTVTRKRIRQMIEMLDVPAANRLGGLKVFRLKYASAKKSGGNFTRLGDRSGSFKFIKFQQFIIEQQ